MLKIRNLKIEIETKSKKFGREIEFNTNGLTIVKGDNHSGKTTLASAIFYGLGMEELLGGKNTIALDSILTTKVPDGGLDLDVITSAVFLEIENDLGRYVSLKRYIKHYDIDPRIVEVTENGTSQFYFLHDGGSAINELGFHNFLERFLNFRLPSVPQYEGGESKLYLQVIFNACFIEQIKGWTDFFAAIPNYGIKDAKKRIVEFILDLNTFEYEKQKNQYEDLKKEIVLDWEKQVVKIQDKVQSISGAVIHLSEEPMGMELLAKKTFEVIFLLNQEQYSIDGYINKLTERKEEISQALQRPKSDTEKKIGQLKERLVGTLKVLHEIGTSKESKKGELEKLEKEQTHLEEEIKKINYLLKIDKYTNTTDHTHKLFERKCPTCDSPLADSVYKNIQVMGLEENKQYIKSQIEILKAYTKALQKEIANEESYFNQIAEEHEANKKIIEYLEKDLVADTQLPSYASMKELVLLEDKLEKLHNIKKELLGAYQEFKEIARRWDDNERLKLPYEMSLEDNYKLKLLDSAFKILLKDFMYGSKREDQVWISPRDPNKYFPMVKIGDETPQPIRYNSSASDFVRSIWAYLIALYEVTTHKQGYHPGLFLFDEPAQHAMTESSQAALFKKLSILGCQSIVFASFENEADDKQDKYSEVTKDLEDDSYRTVVIENRAIEVLSEI